jgi:hypothetical protein
MKNIRERIWREIITRLQAEVCVQHSVHDVQLPIPGCFLLAAPTLSQRRIGQMYYILKEARIIKSFADDRVKSLWEFISQITK